MAWKHYYVNCDKLYDIDEKEKDVCIMYDLNIPPHGGIREEWTTMGMKNGTSKILFVEYSKEDDDPDGVWEGRYYFAYPNLADELVAIIESSGDMPQKNRMNFYLEAAEYYAMVSQRDKAMVCYGD